MSVFITGGTTGLGFEMAKIYLNRGEEVAVCGRDLSKLNLSTLSSEQRLRLTSYTVDVRKREELQNAIKDFAQRKGPLKLVIANAGISMGQKGPIPDFRRAEDIIDINIKGVLYTAETAIELFLQNAKNQEGKKGHLAIVGSVAGFNGLPHTSIYSASKAAVCKLGESWAIDLKPFGIDVTTFAPGFVDTPLTKINKHPMPFMLTAEKAAKIMVKAIDDKKTFFIYPKRMKWCVLPLSYLPRGSYIKLMRMASRLIGKKTP